MRANVIVTRLLNTVPSQGYLKVVPNEVKFHDGTEQNAAYSLDF